MTSVWQRVSLFVCLLVSTTSCIREAIDPLALAPSTPFSTWCPMKGNRMISSRFCQTYVPDHFDARELSVAELIDIALHNNPTTKQTWATARAQAANYGSTLSSFYPNITFNGQYSRQKFGSPIANVSTVTLGVPVNTGESQSVIMNYFTQSGPDVDLSYTLFDFGQRSSAALAAREALYFADLTHNQQIQTIVQTVMTDYYNYLYQKAALRYDEEDLLNAETVLDSANDKFALGLAALGDVAQARTQYLQSKINLTTQKQQVENAFAQMAVDMGVPANIPFTVQPMPEQINAVPIIDDVDNLVALAQEQRQDLLAACANVKSKEASVVHAQRAVYPVLNSQFSTGRYWFEQNQKEPENHWTALITLSFPLFNGFYYRNQVKQATANLDYSKAQLLQTELSIIQNVTTAQMEVKTAGQNLGDSIEYLKSAELQFKIALASYKAGTQTILDVTQAQSSLADARAKKASAQRDWYVALANVAYATGSLCAVPCKEGVE